MMWRAALVGTLMVAATPAMTAVRTLFVGINRYDYSVGKEVNLDHDFVDLSGAINDLVAIRAVLTTPRWGITTGPFNPAAPCAPIDPRAPPMSITLVDHCASRAAILAALTAQITVAVPGDIILFFYSGHGSQADDLTNTQPDGKSSTIVPADSRGGNVHDIVDTDLGILIKAASARGVNVVTMFDSCHSATATRDLRGRVRSVGSEPKPGRATDIAPPPPTPGVAPGYQVHLSAAGDSEIARELPGEDGQNHGVFTTALVQTLNETEPLAYADVAAKIRQTLAAAGADQTPGIIGERRATFLGASQIGGRLFEAKVSADGTLSLTQGALAGVTIGSRYGVFASGGAARDIKAMRTSGVVTEANATAATIKLDKPLAAHVKSPWVLETQHVFDGPRIIIAVDGDFAAKARVTKALSGIELLQVGGGTPAYSFLFGPDSVQLVNAGTGLAIQGPIKTDDKLDANLKELGRQIANYHALLALTARSVSAPEADISLSYACADPTKFYPTERENGVSVVYPGDVIAARLTNSSDSNRYAYLYDLSPDLTITLLRTELTPLDPNASTDFRMEASTLGRDRLLLLTSDNKIEAETLEQKATALKRDMRSDPLTQLLDAARDGNAPRSLEAPGGWSTALIDFIVTPSRGTPPCAPPSHSQP